jgi:hypothetical protein
VPMRCSISAWHTHDEDERPRWSIRSNAYFNAYAVFPGHDGTTLATVNIDAIWYQIDKIAMHGQVQS